MFNTPSPGLPTTENDDWNLETLMANAGTPTPQTDDAEIDLSTEERFDEQTVGAAEKAEAIERLERQLQTVLEETRSLALKNSALEEQLRLSQERVALLSQKNETLQWENKTLQQEVGNFQMEKEMLQIQTQRWKRACENLQQIRPAISSQTLANASTRRFFESLVPDPKRVHTDSDKETPSPSSSPR
ncbi:MAG: hypothetical protein HY939_02555 [Gammaproteobacteria bacterium]|nr:hypothetical protein [Gammaproteobacteria bacterium]